jgi:hypothetical protein
MALGGSNFGAIFTLTGNFLPDFAAVWRAVPASIRCRRPSERTGENKSVDMKSIYFFSFGGRRPLAGHFLRAQERPALRQGGNTEIAAPVQRASGECSGLRDQRYVV